MVRAMGLPHLSMPKFSPKNTLKTLIHWVLSYPSQDVGRTKESKSTTKIEETYICGLIFLVEVAFSRHPVLQQI